MLKEHLQYIYKKLIIVSIIYTVLLAICLYLITNFNNVFYILLLIIILSFYAPILVRYFNYLNWLKKQSKNNEMALIKFISQRDLFFKNLEGHRLAFKQFCIPVKKEINVTILNRLNVIETKIVATAPKEYDLIIDIENKIFLKEIT